MQLVLLRNVKMACQGQCRTNYRRLAGAFFCFGASAAALVQKGVKGKHRRAVRGQRGWHKIVLQRLLPRIDILFFDQVIQNLQKSVDADFVVTAPASPFDERFVGAVTQAIGLAFGDMPIIASQASGATDSMWYRALGIPSYGASGTFLKMSDDYSHGLNERVQTGHIQASLLYYTTLLAALASD